MNDILSEYGSDTSQSTHARPTNGGQVPVKDIPNYSPPQGPIRPAPGVGLHGDNCGNCGTQHG